MADFSHSVQRTQPSATLTKKISSNGNGFTAKTVYDDVFGGPPKFGVPTFSSRIDDYNEIFGSFNSSRVSSIPILDLPIVDESAFAIDVRNSKFDYSEVFGGFDGFDFAVSYEDLLAEPIGGEGREGGGESSSDDVWTSAETGSPSEGSSEGPACADNKQASSNEESYQSLDGSKQFNMLYHKTNQISREDGISVTTHIAELNSVPAFTFVVDESIPSQKAEIDKRKPQVCNLDVDFGGQVVEGKHLKEIMPDPVYHTFTEISESDLKPQKTHLKETMSHQPVSHTVTEISDSDLKHQKGHPIVTMSYQPVCHTATEISEIDPKHQKDQIKETMSHQSVCHTVSQTFETDLKHKKNFGVNETYPTKAFVTVSEINLRTVPSHVPPPSRPPPKLSIKQGDSKRLMGSNIKASENYGLERAVSDGSPPFFDVEVDASSSAAASAAAMKAAMEKAQARLKSAKESMERKRDGLQNRKKLGLKNDLKVEERSEGETTHEGHWLKEKAHGTLERENNEMKGFAVEERGKVTNAVLAPAFQVTGNLVNASEEFVEQKHGEKYKSTQESHRREEGTGEWKVEEQFYELVHTDKLTTAMEAPQHERMEDLISTQRVQEYKMKAAKVAFDHQGKNDTKSKAVKEVCSGEKYRPEFAEGSCKWEDHEKKIKSVQDLHEREEYAKELIAVQEVRDWEENEKIFKVKQDGEEHKTKLKESQEWEEHEKQLRQARERKEYEIKMRKILEQEETEKKQKEALESEENKKREKMAREREENEKTLKEAREREENEKRLKEALEQEENEKRLKEACEREENEKRRKEALEQEEIEKRLKEVHEREENDKRQREDHEREETAKRLKEALELENEKRLTEEREREENEKRLNEAREREETERRLREANEREEYERRQKEAREREENEKRLREVREREENEWRQQELKSEEYEKKLKAAQEDALHREDGRNLETFREPLESAESEKKVKLTNEVCEQGEDKKLKATQEACKQKQDSSSIFDLAQISPEPEEIGKTRESAISASENEWELKAAEKVLHEQDANYKLEVEHVNRSAPEHEELEKKKKVASEAKLRDKEKYSGDPQAAVLQEKNERNKKAYQGALYQEENKDKYNEAQGKKLLVENGKKMVVYPTNVVGERREKLKVGPGVNISQDSERKEKILSESLSTEEMEKEERMQREREREKERLRKVEEDREREREREKDRMAVERATREARERAFADARERAERAAVGRATAEVRQRAMAEARERLEKASAEVREKSLAEKASNEARLRAERAAVERATAEARERAAEKLKAENVAFGARERAERTFSEKYSATSRDSGMRHSSSFSDLRDSQFQSSGSSGSFQRYPSSSNLGASYVNEKYQGTEIESAQRCKARLERHQRTVERAAKALAEKNMRDLLTQREQTERNRLAETLDAEVKRWSNGKEGNLRALLSTLQYILGPESGWQPVPLTEVITAIAVKKAYRKATLCVHPDKLQQRGASIHQKYICEKVFDLLKEAWNKFNSEER